MYINYFLYKEYLYSEKRDFNKPSKIKGLRYYTKIRGDTMGI